MTKGIYRERAYEITKVNGSFWIDTETAFSDIVVESSLRKAIETAKELIDYALDN